MTKFLCALAVALAALSAQGADFGKPIGPSRVYDFTSGEMPDGVRLRKNGILAEDGLCSRDFEREDSQGGAELSGRFTPDGAFLFEAEFEVGNWANTAKVERASRIWDDMGISYGGEKCDNTGLEIGLVQAPDGYWTPYAVLGMGTRRFRVEGVKRRLYDGARSNFTLFFGANGRVVIEFGGLTAEKQIPLCGGLAPSKRYRPVIGSRPVSRYANFDGFVRRVSITPMRRDPAAFLTPGRMAFLRGETNAVLELAIANRSGGGFTDVRVSVDQFGEMGLVKSSAWREDALADGANLPIQVPIETRLRPGHHSMRATLRAIGGDGEDIALTQTIPYAIGPQVGDRMRVAIWGMPLEASVDEIRDFGFTHSYVYLGGAREADADFDPKPFLDTLDRHLAGGIRTMRAFGARLIPPDCTDTNRYLRWRKNGKPPEKPSSFEVSNPEIIERIRKISAFDASFFAGHPSFQGVLPYTEQRENSFPSYNTEPLRYKAETGRDMPNDLRGLKINLSDAKKRFPTGAVPDDDEINLFYRWWLKGGDGWPAIHSACAEEYRKRVKGGDFLSFWDPSVRWAPAWGSGGSIDMLNQWCYAEPEPMNVAGPCEEVLAMADGRPGQKASIMTQLICYRSQVAPKNVVPDNPPDWVKAIPDADFPTIPPDVLQEATWSMIAKPVDAIMYHGWNTIHDSHTRKGYCYTNPESAERMREMLNGVVTPLGPVLRRLKREKPDFAVLESLTTFTMGGPATRGWKSPAVTCAQRARLDPRVVYEETLERDGFDGIKVLYAPQCQFLTESMVARIKAFQAAGGILMADSECVSALKPDIEVKVMSFDPPPETDHTEDVDAREQERDAATKTHQGTQLAKKAMQDAAEEMRVKLAAKGYRPTSDSSSSEIVVFNRQWRDTKYLFAINDHRTFGDYFGPWGLVMEKGLPYRGWVSLDDPENRIGAVYELSRGEEYSFTREGGKVKVPVSFTTNDGRMFAFLPAKIATVEVKAPEAVLRGGMCDVVFTVRGEDGAPSPALLPVEIRIYDALGKEIDGGGWFCAEGGVAKVSFQTNLDDPVGSYRIVCRDRASGLSAEKAVALRH